MGRDGVDPSGPGGGWVPVVLGLLKVVGVLVGLAIGVFGVALWALRCFDTCPADSSVDKILMLLSAALLLTGVAVVIQSVAFRTRWADIASGVLVFVGGLIALTGVVSLLLLPSVDERSASPRIVWLLGVVVVGLAIALVGVPGRRGSNEGDV